MLRFRAAGRSFAIPATQVREVVKLGRLARVPNAPAALLGLANLRGGVLPVLSFAELVEARGGPAGADVVIVVDVEAAAGLAVDAVQSVGGALDGSEPVDAAALLAPLLAGTGGRPGAAMVEDVVAGAEAAHTVPLFVFLVAGQMFALPVGLVEEIIPKPAEITPVPHADAVVLGAASHRGALLPLLSLRVLLGLTGADATRSSVLVARIGAGLVGLEIDGFSAVVQAAESDIDALPAVLGRGQGEARIQAIFRWEAGGRLVSVLAAEHLLHKELTDRLLAGAQRGEGGASQAMSDASEAFLTFSIGGQAFGLPIAAVIEVALPPAALTRLPNAPAFVLGLMNHRGQAIAVIDQASRFDANSADKTRARVVVARSGALEVGFLVESVSGVLRVPASAIRPAPEFGAHARIFDRVAVGGEQLVLIVSPDELLGRAERDLLAGLAQGRSGAA